MENLMVKQEIKVLQQYLHVHPDSEIREELKARIQELEAKQVSNTAEFIKEVTVKEPNTGNHVQMSVFRYTDSGAMFAIDSSYLDQCFDDDTDPVIPDPFNEGQTVTLYNL